MLVLDTNPCIQVLRGRDSAVIETYRATLPDLIFLPSIVVAELLLGARKSQRPSAGAEVELFVSAHEILPFGESEAQSYADIRAYLETNGQKIGANDLLVAATAIVHKATLVTHNTGEFNRVPGLRILDWQV